MKSDCLGVSLKICILNRPPSSTLLCASEAPQGLRTTVKKVPPFDFISSSNIVASLLGKPSNVQG